MKYSELTTDIVGIVVTDEIVDGKNPGSAIVHVTRSFGYGSKHDGDDFEMKVTQDELEKLLGKPMKEIIYVNGNMADCKYKPGHSCHVCGKYLFAKENLHGDSCSEVFSNLMEEVLEIGQIFDRNGCHNFNCCEACMERHLSQFIIENDVF